MSIIQKRNRKFEPFRVIIARWASVFALVNVLNRPLSCPSFSCGYKMRSIRVGRNAIPDRLYAQLRGKNKERYSMSLVCIPLLPGMDNLASRQTWAGFQSIILSRLNLHHFVQRGVVI